MKIFEEKKKQGGGFSKEHKELCTGVEVGGRRVPVSFRKDRRLEFLLQIPAGGRGGLLHRCVPQIL